MASLRGGEVGAASISAMSLFTETIAPTLGTFFSNGMYLSGVPAIIEARENGKLGQLNPIPFAMSLANCVAWLGYGFVTKNPFVFYANGLGVLLGLYSTMTGVRLADPDKRKLVETIVMSSGTLLIAAGYVSSLVLTDAKSRQLLFGYLANGFLMIYYASPLSTLSQVLRERSSASLYWPLSALVCLNSLLWVTYGAAVGDPFIFVPNGFGLTLGIIQILMCVIFPRVDTKAR